jgi:hypothetical protein
MQRMGIGAEDRIPAKFTSREIAAIKGGKIFAGMSERALYWSWGYPQKTNDWGRGGEQMIYVDSHYVYVRGGVVHDLQTLH